MSKEVQQIKMVHDSDKQSLFFQSRRSSSVEWQEIPNENILKNKYGGDVILQRDVDSIIADLIDTYSFAGSFELIFCGQDEAFELLNVAVQQNSAVQEGSVAIHVSWEAPLSAAEKEDEPMEEKVVSEESPVSDEQAELDENMKAFRRSMRELNVTLQFSGLLCYALPDTSQMFARFFNRYYYFPAKDLDPKLQSNPAIEDSVVEAYQTQNLIGGYDTETLNDKNAIYFLYDGILLRLNGTMQSIHYEEIFEISIDPTGLNLCLVGKESVLISANSHFDSRVLKAIRKSLTSICHGMPGFFEEDTGNIVSNMLCERIASFIKSPDSNKAYTRFDFYDPSVEKKLRNALQSFAKRVQRDDVVAFIDTSLFSNGKDGILFTADGIAFDYAFEKVYLLYKEIEYTELKKHELVFYGHFSNMKDPDSLPSINDIYFKLPELKDCIDEICLHF